MITFSDIPPDEAPAGTPTVAPNALSVNTGPTSAPLPMVQATVKGPQAMQCPYEIAPNGAVQRRRAGSTAPAPDPCPAVQVNDQRGQPAPAPATINIFGQKITIPSGGHSQHAPVDPAKLDPAKVAEHRSSRLTPICTQAGVPSAYLDACINFLQGRGATIDQFVQLMAQDPNAVAAMQNDAMAAMMAAGGGKGFPWAWVIGGVVVAGVATTAVVLVVRHRRRGGRAGGLRGAELEGRASDLITEYNRVMAHPSRHSNHEIKQLAHRLDVVSAAPGREGLARRAEKLHALVDERRAA